MLKLSYETESPQYRLPSDVSWGPNPVPDYNPSLQVPPRIYAETANGLNGVFSTPIATAESYNIISLVTTNAILYWPSYTWCVYFFDATTGEYVRREPLNVSAYLSVLYPCRDDSIFAGDVYASAFEVDPKTLVEIPDTRLYGEQFGLISMQNPCFDKGTDRILMSNGVEVRIYRWSDKTLLHTLKMTEAVHRIIPADERRAYVRTVSNLFVLIDYMEARVLGIVRIPGVYSGASQVSWDWRKRRFLVCNPSADTATGACTLKVQGYYPIPQPTALTKPVPLKALRKGRRVPFWVRAIGDVGEGVGGRAVAATVTGGTLVSSLIQTGGDGSARINVDLTATGSVTVACSVEAP